MGTPTRFPYGIATGSRNGPFGDFGEPSPLIYHEDFDDFNRFAAAEWTITRVGTTPTEALADGNGGLLRLTTVSSASSSTFLQKVGASFLPTPDKQFWFATRLLVSSALDTQFVAGIQIIDTTPLDATDGIYFIKPTANSASVDFICRRDASAGSVTRAAVATVADSTFINLAFYYNGRGMLNIFVNNRNVADLAIPSAASFLPDALTTLSFGVQNGGSTSRTMDVDYLYAAIER